MHKLSLAKYKYFSKTLHLWQPFGIDHDKIVSSSIILDTDWITCDGFRCVETNRIITITKLQRIVEKKVFINNIEVITGYPFPE